MSPPLLVPPIPGKPLLLHLTISEAAMGAVLGQHDETWRKKQAIYYTSKKFISYKTRYSMAKKLCYGLTWGAKRLCSICCTSPYGHLQNRSPEVHIWETLFV
jgi:hypothetical protein